MYRKTFIQWIDTVSQDHKWRNFGRKLSEFTRAMPTQRDFAEAMARAGCILNREHPSDTRFTRYLRKHYD